MRLNLFFIGSTFLIFSSLVCAADLRSDCDGCRDHPVLPRYPGSALVGYDQRAFDQATFPLSQIADEDDQASSPKLLKSEGKRTQLFYWEPEGRSGLEVFANYREATSKAGMTVLWTCSGEEECGKRFAARALELMHIDLNNTAEARAGTSDAEQPRYLIAKLARADGDFYAAVFTADMPLHAPPRAGTYVVLVQAKPMDRGMVTMDANTLDQSLINTGKAVLYGIYFDFDKAEIKPESKTQLDQIGKLLADHSEIRLTITGYTDDQGSADYNLALSRRRADAIVTTLVRDYSITPDRLKAQGMGASSPVAGNDNEAGRAKNRRVELTKQAGIAQP